MAGALVVAGAGPSAAGVGGREAVAEENGYVAATGVGGREAGGVPTGEPPDAADDLLHEASPTLSCAHLRADDTCWLASPRAELAARESSRAKARPGSKPARGAGRGRRRTVGEPGGSGNRSAHAVPVAAE